VRFTVRTDQDPEVLARATTYAWLDGSGLELVPVAGFPELTASARSYVERWALTHLHAAVVWRGIVAEFTPAYGEAAA
jgi:hypothetical protein